MRDIIITNNSRVMEGHAEKYSVVYVEGKMLEVLLRVRDHVHKGHKLLSHPLSGSVKPNENPFKSVLITSKNGDLDTESLQIIENAIITAGKFPPKYGHLPDKILEDFRLVDYSLIASALGNK